MYPTGFKSLRSHAFTSYPFSYTKSISSSSSPSYLSMATAPPMPPLPSTDNLLRILLYFGELAPLSSLKERRRCARVVGSTEMDLWKGLEGWSVSLRVASRAAFCFWRKIFRCFWILSFSATASSYPPFPPSLLNFWSLTVRFLAAAIICWN